MQILVLQFSPVSCYILNESHIFSSAPCSQSINVLRAMIMKLLRNIMWSNAKIGGGLGVYKFLNEL